MTLSGHTGSVVRWEKRLDAGGWTNIANTNTTYSETPSSAGTWDYRAVVQSGSCATAYSSNMTIVVNPTTVAGTLSGGTTPICLGSSTGTITLAGYTGSIIRWEYRRNGGGWNNIGNTNPTYSSTPALSGTYDYHVMVQSSPCGALYSNIITIVVDPATVGGSIAPASSTVCTGTNSTTLTLSGHTGSIVKWQYSVDNWITPVDISNTTTTLTATNLTTSTKYRAVVKSGACSEVNSVNATITVSPASVGGTTSGGTTPICFSSGTGNITVSGYTGTITIWQRQINGGGYNNISGTGGMVTYSETPSSAGTWDYRAQITSSPCATTYSTATTIVVDPTSVGGSVTGGSTPICFSSGTGTMTLSGHTGDIQKWQKRVNAGGWTDIVNTNNTYSEIPSSSGTWEYRAEVKSGTCAAIFSIARTIVVDPASVGGSISGGTTPICYGVSTGTMTLSGYVGSVQKWQKQLNSGGWTDIVNTAAMYSETPSSSGTWEYRAEVKNGACPSTFSGIQTIVVRPRFQVSQLHDDISICNNTATDLNVTLTGGTSPYTVNYTRNGTPQTALPGYISGTNFSTGILTTNTYVYAITSVTDAFNCPVESTGTNVTVTVGAPLTGATLTGSGNACLGASSTLKSVITGGAPPYTLDITGYGIVNNYFSNTDIPIGSLTLGTHNYTLATVTDNCPNSISPAAPYSITINDNPDISATTPATQTICNNTAATITLNSTVGNTKWTYTVASVPSVTWTAGKDPVDGSITEIDGNGTETLTRTLQHNHVDPVTVTYNITPTGPATTNCPGTAINRTVVVEPTPAAAISNNTQTLCDGASLTAMVVSATTTHIAARSFDMAIVATTGSLANLTAGGGGNALTTVTNGTYPYNITGTLTNNTDNAIVIEYRVTPRLTGCSNGTDVVATVTIEPTPKAAISNSTQTLCDGAALTAMAVTNSCTHTLAPTVRYGDSCDHRKSCQSYGRRRRQRADHSDKWHLSV